MAVTASEIPPGTGPLDIEHVFRRYVAAWEARDPDRIIGLHAPDTQFWVHGAAPAVTGRDETRAAFARVFEQFPQFGCQIRRSITGTRSWVLDWALTAVLSDDGGRSWPVRIDCLDVVNVDDAGLVTRKDTWFDAAHLERALAGPDAPPSFVERFEAAWKARDADQLGALFHPDAVVRQAPVRRPFTGAEVPTYLRQIFATLPDLELEMRHWATRDDIVLIEWTIRATGPDGDPVVVNGIDRFTLEDGLAIDEIVCFDTLPLWERLDPSMVRGDLISLS